jgi:hypothetical protein
VASEANTEWSLCCITCDAGMNEHSAEQALRNGWRDLEWAPDAPTSNFLGQCPECFKYECQRAREDRNAQPSRGDNAGEGRGC